MTLATATPYSSAGGGEAGEDLVTVFPLSLSTLSVESHLIVGAAGGAGDEDCSACCAKLFAICNTESFLGFAPSPASGAAAGICGSGTGAGAGGWLGAACILTPCGARLCTGSGAASCGISAGATTRGARLASPSMTSPVARAGAGIGAGAPDETPPLVPDSGRRTPPVGALALWPFTAGATGCCCALQCVASLRTLGSPRPSCVSTLGASDAGLDTACAHAAA
jgi:hypothetical protein